MKILTHLIYAFKKDLSEILSFLYSMCYDLYYDQAMQITNKERGALQWQILQRQLLKKETERNCMKNSR